MVKVNRVPRVECADARGEYNSGHRGYHRFIKKQKARAERRRARANPECYPTYGKYVGWET